MEKLCQERISEGIEPDGQAAEAEYPGKEHAVEYTREEADGRAARVVEDIHIRDAEGEVRDIGEGHERDEEDDEEQRHRRREYHQHLCAPGG